MGLAEGCFAGGVAHRDGVRQGLVHNGREGQIQSVGGVGGGRGNQQDLRCGRGNRGPGCGQRGLGLVGGEAGVRAAGRDGELTGGQAERGAKRRQVAAGYIAARGNGDGFASAVDAGGVKRVKMQQLGGQLRGQRLGLAERGLRRQLGYRGGHGHRSGEGGSGQRSIQRDQTMDQRLESGGHGEAAGQHGACSPGRDGGVNLGLEGLLHLGYRSREFNPTAACRQRSNLQALALQPGGDRGHVGGGVGVGIGKGGRGEPVMVLGRSRILLVRQLGGQRLLLRRGGIEQQQHALQAVTGRRGARVGRGLGALRLEGRDRTGAGSAPVPGQPGHRGEVFAREVVSRRLGHGRSKAG